MYITILGYSISASQALDAMEATIGWLDIANTASEKQAAHQRIEYIAKGLTPL
jgi:hypothetical protein